MNFLDQRIQQVRNETSRNILISLSRIGVPLADSASKIPLLTRLSMSMSMVSKMWALVNDPAVLNVFSADKSSAGNWTLMDFLSTYMNFKLVIEPEEFNVYLILLTANKRPQESSSFESAIPQKDEESTSKDC